MSPNLLKRKVGAKKALDRVCYETGIDKEKLVWVDSLYRDESKYRLRVFAGGGSKDFVFTNENFSNYAKGQPDDTLNAIIHWIKNLTIRLPSQ